MSLSAMKKATIAGFSPKRNTRHHVRSISLPKRLHPSTVKIEQVLNKLKSLKASTTLLPAEKVLSSIHGLEELYVNIEELLNLRLTQQAISGHEHDKWVNELLDDSISHLDTCSRIRDVIFLMKGDVGKLQSVLRRTRVGGDLGIEKSVNAYVSSTKKVKKDLTKCLAELKQSENKNWGDSLLELDNHLLAVVRVLRESGFVTISVLKSLLIWLSMPASNQRPSKWILVAKLVQKGVVACEDTQDNVKEFEGLDFVLANILGSQCSSKDLKLEMINCAQKRLETLEARFQGLEDGLEGLLRHLMCARVFFLNILSLK
ncbi:Protein BPS1, chloroplastic [Dillenia turbinata]|uniref:Protein BPS1, chloroplastic n=1 Tax=Dillenia turbinata TaxID=194707 RepID=A0AAN8Z4K9_9MAGN